MRHFFPTSPSAPACSGGKTTPPVVPSDSQQPPPSPSADPPLPEPPLTTAQLQQTKAELEGLLARVDELLAKRAALEASPVTVQTTAVTPPPAVDVGKKTKRAVAERSCPKYADFPAPYQTKGERDLTGTTLRAPASAQSLVPTPAPRNHWNREKKAPPRPKTFSFERLRGESSLSDDDDDDCPKYADFPAPYQTKGGGQDLTGNRTSITLPAPSPAPSPRNHRDMEERAFPRFRTFRFLCLRGNSAFSSSSSSSSDDDDTDDDDDGDGGCPFTTPSSSST